MSAASVARHVCRVVAIVGLFAAAGLIACAPPAHGQDVVGRRLFPEQLVLREPFVESTLTLPAIAYLPDSRSLGHETRWTQELKLRLTNALGIAIAGTLVHVETDDGHPATGFDNPTLALTYQAWKSEAREALTSLALEWQVGQAGARAVGAERASIVTPSLLFGKGLGDLDERLRWLKPVAITGALGISLATERTSDGSLRTARWGAVIEYSVPYLEAELRHAEFPSTLNRLIPLLELDFATPLDGAASGRTTGTVNPGFVWAGKAFQVGIEAAIPVNDRTGKGLGVRALLRFSLDEIIPRLGRPLFARP